MAAQFYTKEFKQRNRVTAAAVTMAAGVAPFLVAIAVLQFWMSPPPFARALVTAATLICAGLAPWYSHGTLALLGNLQLKKQVSAIAAEAFGESVEGVGGVFVGFSPGEKIRIWEGETDRDVGFVALQGGSLVFVGDEYRWRLPKEQIEQIELVPPTAGVWRIVIRWHARAEGARALSMVCREANTIDGLEIVTRRLYGALRAWYWADIPADPERAPRWGYPPTDVGGGWDIDRPIGGSCTTVIAVGAMVALTIWRVSGTLVESEAYYMAILWAGLIAAVGAVLIGYLLNYLRAWEADRDERRKKH